MRQYFPKMYRSFEEFEREELRRGSSLQTSVDEMLDEMFADELDFDFESGRQKSKRAADEED
jgi:hypothetical protein